MLCVRPYFRPSVTDSHDRGRSCHLYCFSFTENQEVNLGYITLFIKDLRG